MQKPDQIRSLYTLVVYALLTVRESIDRDQDLKWNRLRSLYTLDSIVDTVVNYLSYPKRSSNQLNCHLSWPFIGHSY